MKRNLTIYENPILYLLFIIIGLGTVMMYSASSTISINRFDDYSFYLNRHLIRLGISIIAFIFFYNVNFKWYKKFSFPILFLSWAIMVSAYIFNDNTTTNRWLIIFGKNIFTTSDFARLALIIFTANFIDDHRKKINNINLIATKYLPYFLITILLIYRQPDLSTSFSLTLIICSLLLIAGLKIKFFLIPIITSISAVLSYIFYTKNYQYYRLISWMSGEYNRQTENSIQALGNGGIFGVGFGKSIIKDGFMPEVHTDFILPIIGEELGFIGIVLIFILYLLLYFYGIKVSKTAPNIFSSMISLGITINILYYFLINASYVVGVLPTTGLPIPFISYGGSQTMFSLISIAILMNISKYTNVYKYKTL